MKLRAFLFEDDLLVRSLLQMLLEHRGYEVVAFSDPALCPLHPAPACQCPPGQTCADVILSDLQMPNVHGLEFAERQLEKGCKCQHRALMSGAWSEADRARAQELGCRVFDKPVSSEQLQDWLDEVEQTVDPGRMLFDGYRVKL